MKVELVGGPRDGERIMLPDQSGQSVIELSGEPIEIPEHLRDKSPGPKPLEDNPLVGDVKPRIAARYVRTDRMIEDRIVFEYRVEG